jgi:Transposase and inactivated derivatives
MEFFVGLDVSVKTTSICVMDTAGTIIREGKAESSPEAISAFLAAADRHYVRVGLEAGPLCQWLYAGLTKAGFPVICIETRHAQAVLSARPNKTDRNDARGIAQMMRVGLYLPVHVKTLASQKIRALLSGRRFLQSKLLDVENSIRGLLRNFGLKVGVVSRAQYERRILELIEDAILVGDHRADARRTPRRARAVRHPAQEDAGAGTRRRGLPSAHERSWRRTLRGLDLSRRH